jgi:hypothetical protein
MALDFAELVAPAHTAVVTCEMQRGIIGDLTAGPELAAEAAEGYAEASFPLHSARSLTAVGGGGPPAHSDLVTARNVSGTRAS